MDRLSADELLTGNPLVPCIEGAVASAKELERTLLEAEIPARLAKPPTKACCGPGGCGCGAKVQVMVREEDLPKVAALFRNEWMEALQREGTLEAMQLVPMKVEGQVLDPAADPPCPACGTAAPLVEGACSDCGLQLDN
jgi:hypothetical protein